MVPPPAALPEAVVPPAGGQCEGRYPGERDGALQGFLVHCHL